METVTDVVKQSKKNMESTSDEIGKQNNKKRRKVYLYTEVG